MPGYLNSGSVFASPFTAFSATTAGGWDLWGIQAGPSDKVAIHEIRIGTSSTSLYAAALQVIRGSTASSTSGGAIVNNLKGQTNASTDTSSVTLPSSNLVSTASAVLLYADALPIDNNAPYVLRPSGIDMTPWIILEVNQRLHVRITTPSLAATLSGTLVYEVLGRSGVF